MPGNGSIGLYGLAVDNRIVDPATVRKVMQLSYILILVRKKEKKTKRRKKEKKNEKKLDTYDMIYSIFM